VGYNDAPDSGHVLETITDSGGADELVLEANPDELVVNLQDDGHLALYWAGLSQGVIIVGGSAIEKFTFANGVSLSRAELLALGSNPPQPPNAAAVHQPCFRSGRPLSPNGRHAYGKPGFSCMEWVMETTHIVSTIGYTGHNDNTSSSRTPVRRTNHHFPIA
jgi:hypothetical protein